MHQLLPIIISILGLCTGIDVIIRTWKLKDIDTTLKVFLYILGVMNIYIGIIYGLVALGIVGAIPATQASLFMRPVNILAVITPYMIIRRLGL